MNKPSWLRALKQCLFHELSPGGLAKSIGICKTTAYDFCADPDKVERTSVVILLKLLEHYHVDQNDNK
jgi:hypothetical protein